MNYYHYKLKYPIGFLFDSLGLSYKEIEFLYLSDKPIPSDSASQVARYFSRLYDSPISDICLECIFYSSVSLQDTLKYQPNSKIVTIKKFDTLDDVNLFLESNCDKDFVSITPDNGSYLLAYRTEGIHKITELGITNIISSIDLNKFDNF